MCKSVAARERRTPGSEPIWSFTTSADFSGSNLSSAILIQAKLAEAKLIGANLSRAALIAAKLTEADLTWADLREATLFGADLREANMRDAKIATEQLSIVHKLEGATLPDGSKYLSGPNAPFSLKPIQMTMAEASLRYYVDHLDQKAGTHRD